MLRLVSSNTPITVSIITGVISRRKQAFASGTFSSDFDDSSLHLSAEKNRRAEFGRDREDVNYRRRGGVLVSAEQRDRWELQRIQTGEFSEAGNDDESISGDDSRRSNFLLRAFSSMEASLQGSETEDDSRTFSHRFLRAFSSIEASIRGSDSEGGDDKFDWDAKVETQPRGTPADSTSTYVSPQAARRIEMMRMGQSFESVDDADIRYPN